MNESKPEIIKLIIAPIDIRISVDDDFIKYVKDNLMGKHVTKHEKINVKMIGHSVPFFIVESEPSEGYVASSTELTILPEPYKTKMEKKYELKILVLEDKDTFVLSDSDKIMYKDVIWDSSRTKPEKLVLWVFRYKGNKME